MTQRQLESSIGKNIPMIPPWIIDVLVCNTNGWMPAIEIYPIEEKNVKCRWIGYVRVLILPQALEASPINRIGRANRKTLVNDHSTIDFGNNILFQFQFRKCWESFYQAIEQLKNFCVDVSPPVPIFHLLHAIHFPTNRHHFAMENCYSFALSFLLVSGR